MIPAQPISGPQSNKADQSESRYLPCLLSMAGNFHSMKRTEFYLMGFIVIQVPKRLTGNANKYKTNSPRSLATVFSLPVTVIKPFRSFSFTFVKTEKNPSDIYIYPYLTNVTKHWIVSSKDMHQGKCILRDLCVTIFVCFVKVSSFHGCMFGKNILYSLVIFDYISLEIFDDLIH